jgi:hypothetical protein
MAGHHRVGRIGRVGDAARWLIWLSPASLPVRFLRRAAAQALAKPRLEAPTEHGCPRLRPPTKRWPIRDEQPLSRADRLRSWERACSKRHRMLGKLPPARPAQTKHQASPARWLPLGGLRAQPAVHMRSRFAKGGGGRPGQPCSWLRLVLPQPPHASGQRRSQVARGRPHSPQPTTDQSPCCSHRRVTFCQPWRVHYPTHARGIAPTSPVRERAPLCQPRGLFVESWDRIVRR